MKIAKYTLIALLATAASAYSATLLNVNFGSDNDGLGGFTTSTQSSQTVFSTEDDSIQTRRGSGGNTRSAGLWTDAFTGANALSRDAGSTYTFTTVVGITSHEQDNNANVSLMLFSDAAQEDPSGITLKMLFGGSNSSLQIDSGVNTFDSTAPDEQLAWTGQALDSGNLFTLQGIVNFTANDANVTFNLTDSADPANTASVTRTFDKTLLAGDFHGVGTQHTRIVFDTYSFSVIPEPTTALLVGGLGMLVLLRRRR